MWLNACSSGISIATGISSVATFATFVGLPVNMALGAASMTGVIASGIISVLIKKYQKKLKKVAELIDTVTPALVVFERVISGTLKNGIIDEEELNTLQMLHLERLNELTGVDRHDGKFDPKMLQIARICVFGVFASSFFAGTGNFGQIKINLHLPSIN